MQKNIVIIGGGASGLTAAISAAAAGANVTVLDHNHRVGQKILATGNGKCNLSNLNQEMKNYRGDNPEFAGKVLANFSVSDTKHFFDSLGLLLKERQGYLYPVSEQASTVLDVLRLKCNDLEVKLACNINVKHMTFKRDKFTIKIENEGKEEIIYADVLILAAGGCASPKTGSDGSGYKIAGNFGHHIIEPVPALVGLCCMEKFFKEIAGVRAEANLTLFINDKSVISERGELQFTNYGISGIPVFQISRFASKAIFKRQKVTVDIDLLPAYSMEELMDFLNKQIKSNKSKTMEQHLMGLLNKKLAHLILKQALTPQNIIAKIKNFVVTIDKPNSFEQAQVCAGGVDTNEIDPLTMESKLIKNLYIIGELLGIDGACGGYNLQWAWSTGIIAGRSAAKAENDTNTAIKTGY
jgi:predicted Rossmann fold flavoprotein